MQPGEESLMDKFRAGTNLQPQERHRMKDVLMRASARYGLPMETSRFMLRAIIGVVVWKASYLLVLRPSGIPDDWLVRQLGSSTVRMLRMLGEEGYSAQHSLQRLKAGDPVLETVSVIHTGGDRAMLSIEPPCNGLDLMVLSAGFVLCYSGSWRRKLIFIPLCILSVYLMNILRCGLLCLLWAEIPQFFDSMHKFVFNLFAYACVFGLWMAYAGQWRPTPAKEAGKGSVLDSGGEETSVG